ncbi:MAG TPA: hypothetical protein VK968_14410, partial [Roseimicrobium sp.]|nr:hypothetical protein [Roseimicrobium sp.]
EAKAQRLMEGLLKLSGVSTVRGFVARGMATDGQGHFPMGSNDQTSPWFYGLWLYLGSDICTLAQRERIVARLTETAEAIQSNKWLVPAEEPFRIRGSFAGVTWESAPRAVFIAKLMHHVTKDPKWDRIYRELLTGRAANGEGPDRLGVCERGMIFEHEKRHSWTAVGGVTSLRALWEMETDGKLKAAYGRGLQASAKLAMDSLPLAQQFDVEKPQKFEGDWRKLNPWWEKQMTEQDAVRVAMVQVKELGKMSPGRYQEHTFVREPSFAAWVASLAPDKSVLTAAAPEIEKVIGHYRYNTLRYSQFFPCESAWWRLRTTLG